MTCRKEPQGIRKVIQAFAILKVRWRMVYGPRIIHGKIKEALGIHKERKNERKNNEKI